MEIKAEIAKKYSLAANQNHIRFLNQLQISNPGESAIENLFVVAKFDPPLFTDKVWTIDRIDPQQTIDLSSRNSLELAPSALQELTEQIIVTIKFSVIQSEQILVEDIQTTELLPRNHWGGERRLNVAITRATSEVHLFTSFDSSMIDLSRTQAEAVRHLKTYIDFADSGNLAIARAETGFYATDKFDSDFEEEVADQLRKHGWTVKTQIGISKFRIDLGVVHPDFTGRFLAGIECDGATYHSSHSARDRDRIRQIILEKLGWTLVRIWSTDFFKNPKAVIQHVHNELNSLLKDSRTIETETKEKEAKEKQENVIQLPNMKAMQGPASYASVAEDSSHADNYIPATNDRSKLSHSGDNSDLSPATTTDAVNIFTAEDPTGRKLEYVIFMGKHIAIKSMGELFLVVLRVLFNLDPKPFSELPLSRLCDLQENIHQKSEQLNGDIYIKTTRDNAYKLKAIKQALQIYQVEAQLDIKYREIK